MVFALKKYAFVFVKPRPTGNVILWKPDQSTRSKIFLMIF
jgi:hypothetical protein